MIYSRVMSFTILLELVILADSHPPDYFEKNWMDKCDLKKLNLAPIVETTTKKEKEKRKMPGHPLFPGEGAGFRFYKVNNHPKIDVLAKMEQLISELKTKFIAEAAERGTSVEMLFDGPKADERGFLDDDYDYWNDIDNSESKPLGSPKTIKTESNCFRS